MGVLFVCFLTFLHFTSLSLCVVNVSVKLVALMLHVFIAVMPYIQQRERCYLKILICPTLQFMMKHLPISLNCVCFANCQLFFFAC